MSSPSKTLSFEQGRLVKVKSYIWNLGLKDAIQITVNGKCCLSFKAHRNNDKNETTLLFYTSTDIILRYDYLTINWLKNTGRY